MSNYETWALTISAGVLISGVVFAGFQLRQLVLSSRQTAEANKIANLMAVIDLERSIAEARYRIAAAVARLGECPQDPEDRDFKIAKALYAEAKEQYLNVSDRLCSCIIRGLVDEEIYRRDYRQWVVETVAQHREQLGPDTRHRNILEVHEKWSEDKSARDPSIA